MNNKEVKFSGYVEQGNTFLAMPNDITTTAKLPPGVYRPTFNPMSGELRFERMAFSHDAIVDLPSAEYDRVTKELQHFLKPETRQAYKNLGYVYKRSALLHGRPGTGKTMIVNRVVRDVVAGSGVVLWANSAQVVALALAALDSTQPDTFIAVVFEEFDSIVEDQESFLLTLLDGQVQKDGVMYLATTNYIDKIPARIMRPGRFATVQQVAEPTLKARLAYLSVKVPSLSNADKTAIAGATDGMTIDELKEVVQSYVLMGKSLEEAVEGTRRSGNMEESTKLDDNEDFDQDSESPFTSVLKDLYGGRSGRRR